MKMGIFLQKGISGIMFIFVKKEKNLEGGFGLVGGQWGEETLKWKLN